MNTRTIAQRLLLPLAFACGASGCAAFKLDPPTGFAEVERDEDGAHMKANNDVGLRVHVFHNVRGGNLAFWSRDLVEKLGQRGYQLTKQTPAESRNGVAGTRFDFAYTPVGKDEGPRFYSVVLFVSDKHRVVLGLAGREEYRAQYEQELDAVIGELKVRGCKPASKICKSEQPAALSTPSPKPSTSGPDKAASDASIPMPGPEANEA